MPGLVAISGRASAGGWEERTNLRRLRSLRRPVTLPIVVVD